MEISNLPDAELKTLVKRMLRGLRGRIEKQKKNKNRFRKHKKKE